ncbi:MAG: inosine monophosphate cyclohydrolase [Clostridia bacterium]|nr:inosine monophosphate cyclohydrolase [Clostridia bacterium]
MAKLPTLRELIGSNAYPGRGVAIGENASRETVIVYFIMGRSENSRNRVFEETEDGIRTRAFDEKKCTDPSLIIYNPVRTVGELIVVTNGDQTDTIRGELLLAEEPDREYGERFAKALGRREFEPDAPNFTPRISGIAAYDGYELSILKSEDQSGTVCQRNFFKYSYETGVAHLIHTYEHDGSPIPTFRGEPRRFACPEGSAEEVAKYCWSCLDEANRVSLYAIRLGENGRESFIINRHD